MLRIACAVLAFAAGGIAGGGAALSEENAGAGVANFFADCSEPTCRAEKVERLKTAARDGDDYALVTLELLRARGEPGAPNLAEIISIEIARAETGDAMTAWRLANRYRTGDGVVASQAEMIRWLKVAASEDPDVYPKSVDAAYSLCETLSRGEAAPADSGDARKWCRIAAGAGHAGAAMVIARLRASDD
ncbi:MAG: hypothetical protein WD076_10150 [Parvularculaceae bacterium]